MNSECLIPGYLHDYRITKQLPGGVIEHCRRCRDKKYFRNNTPNRIYLSFHLRQSLQPWQPRFKKEYEKQHTNR